MHDENIVDHMKRYHLTFEAFAWIILALFKNVTSNILKCLFYSNILRKESQ